MDRYTRGGENRFQKGQGTPLFHGAEPRKFRPKLSLASAGRRWNAIATLSLTLSPKKLEKRK